MMQRVLIPLYRLDINYIVRHGRRWSVLEHLVLSACEKPMSAQELARRTQMPMRLISECLVNLLRVGWVDLRGSASGNLFSTTAAGLAASAKSVPDHLLEPQRRSAQLYVERLSGEYFSLKELTVIRRDTPGFGLEEIVEPRIFTGSAFGPELIDRLPMRRDDTFERFRDTPKVVPGDLFAVVQVGDKGIEGLPHRTPAAVGLAILEALKARQMAHATSGRATVALPDTETALGDPLKDRGALVPCKFEVDTLVVGAAEHFDAAVQAITNAQRLVIIHSTFVGKNLQLLLPAIQSAAAGGAQVHIYWGRKDDPEGLEQNPSEVAARLAVSKIPSHIRQNIHLGEQSTDSHAKIILVDAGEGYSVLLGSCNWLCSPYKSVEASVRVREPSLVGIIAQKLAALLAPTVGYDLVVGQLLSIHTECSGQPHATGAHRAMLVHDQDHYAAVRDAMNQVDRNGAVLLGSHKFGHAGETTVLDPMRAAAKHGAQVRIFYSKVLPNFGKTAAISRGAELLVDKVEIGPTADNMHAKFLAWGSTLLVTSFNFLSASVNASHRSGSEIGILLDGPGIVEDFERRLCAHGIASEIKGGRSVKAQGKRRRRRHRGKKQHG